MADDDLTLSSNDDTRSDARADARDDPRDDPRDDRRVDRTAGPGAASARRRNPLGVVSLIAAILFVVLSIVRSALNGVLPLIMQRFETSASTLFYAPTIVLAVVALVALATGAIALSRRGSARTAALIGTTVGASALITIVGGQALSTLAALAVTGAGI